MALLFVVEEEPGLLLDQRAADRSAELLQDVDGLGDAVGVTSVFSALFAGKTDQAGLAVGRGVGSEEGEIGVTAAAEWQVIEVVTIDDSTERRVGGAEGGSLRGYEHHLR